MPHIRAVFVDTPQMREFLATSKGTVRGIVAFSLSRPAEEIALIPEPIREGDLELADNVLPLEFVIDAGSMEFAHGTADVIGEQILDLCPGADAINFGVWPCGKGGGFTNISSLDVGPTPRR